LDALKAAFYAVNKINSSDADQILSYQLWQIAKKLTSGDVILLRTLFRERSKVLSNNSRQILDCHIAQESGFQLSDLVNSHFKNLGSLSLVDISAHDRFLPVNPTRNYLTDLGLKFCQNIDEFEFDLLRANGEK
jgi:hypothetical protein